MLSNIYLDRMDKYVEKTLLPVYNMGDQRKLYRPYMRMHKAIWKMERNGQRKEARPMRRQLQQLPSRDPNDPSFRRLHYIRYADDWLLGFTGTRREAEDIKGKVGRFFTVRVAPLGRLLELALIVTTPLLVVCPFAVTFLVLSGHGRKTDLVCPAGTVSVAELLVVAADAVPARPKSHDEHGKDDGGVTHGSLLGWRVGHGLPLVSTFSTARAPTVGRTAAYRRPVHWIV